jgi:hypothetical protein
MILYAAPKTSSALRIATQTGISRLKGLSRRFPS